MNAGRSRNFRKENKPRPSVPRAIGDAGIDVPVTPANDNDIGMHKRLLRISFISYDKEKDRNKEDQAITSTETLALSSVYDVES